jgi:predicted nucleic acid-binding protein
VISNFASINQLDLLRRLFGALYISTEVYEEIQSGLEEGYQFYAGIDQMTHPFVHDGWIRLTSMADEAEIGLYGGLPSRFHRGEASCLVIARCRGWMLLTDLRIGAAFRPMSGMFCAILQQKALRRLTPKSLG